MCSNCNYQDWVNDINDMLFDDDYSFAETTLSGIKEWVEINEHITEKQINAVENIKSAVENRN